MLIYFIVFSICIVFLIVAQSSFKKGNKFIGVFASLLVIIILSLLAGMRTINIGDDTKGYVQIVYDMASQQNGYANFIKSLVVNSNIEFLYATINYIVCYFKFPINVLYFIFELIPLIFIYKACYDNKDENGNYILYFICFMFLFFNKSLNMCRQTISIAILIYAYKYALNRKFFKYSFFGLIAMGFHITAIIFIPTYFLSKIISNSKREIKRVFIVIILLLMTLKYQDILNFIVLNLKMIDTKYLYYSSSSLGIGNVPLLEFVFVILFGLMSICLYFKQKNTISTKEKMYIYFLIITPIIYSLGIIGNFAFRFSYYFYYYIIFVIPLFKNSIRNNESKKIMNLIIIMCLFIYSYLYYGYIGYDHTTPYQSIITQQLDR